MSDMWNRTYSSRKACVGVEGLDLSVKKSNGGDFSSYYCTTGCSSVGAAATIHVCTQGTEEDGHEGEKRERVEEEKDRREEKANKQVGLFFFLATRFTREEGYELFHRRLNHPIAFHIRFHRENKKEQ